VKITAIEPEHYTLTLDETDAYRLALACGQAARVCSAGTPTATFSELGDDPDTDEELCRWYEVATASFQLAMVALLRGSTTPAGAAPDDGGIDWTRIEDHLRRAREEDERPAA
jgi:hypothetical protein